MSYKKILALMLALSCYSVSAAATDSAAIHFLRVTTAPQSVTSPIILIGLVVIGLTRRRDKKDRWS